MDKTSLIKILHNRVNTSTDLDDILAISKCIEVLKAGTVGLVSTYTELPSLATVNGSVYFVEDEGRLYFNIGSYWMKVTIPFNRQLWGWGQNSYGRLGDGTTTNRSSPVSTSGGIKDWVQVSAGRFHNATIRTDGTLLNWGRNSEGQLGDDTTVSKNSPISPLGGINDWVNASAGYYHTIAIRANGTAWGWGQNNRGQLGTGNNTKVSSPVSVVGGFTDWIQISGGSDHTAAIRANGTAWCWGMGQQGRLGNNNTIDTSSPVSVVGGFTDWSQISAGKYHTSAIRANGTAWGWGIGQAGRLGDNTQTDKSSPVSVVGGFTDWVQISAGNFHTAAVRANGTAWAWGQNNGRLGNNTTTNQSSPVSVVGGFTDWVQLSTGYYHTAGIRANGTAWSWGQQSYGRLGNNNSTQSIISSPVSVVGGFTDWIQVSSRANASLAIRSVQ